MNHALGARTYLTEVFRGPPQIVVDAREAPHDCDLPDCLGAENKRKLAEFDSESVRCERCNRDSICVSVETGFAGESEPLCGGCVSAERALQDAKLTAILEALEELLAAWETDPLELEEAELPAHFDRLTNVVAAGKQALNQAREAS